MRSTYLKLMFALFAIVQLLAVERAVLAAERAEQRVFEIGVQAYIYAYPMVLMELTRQISTNVRAPAGVLAPMNQFAHMRAFPDHTFREVVRPNADTLYSIVWFDVAKEPIVLSVPDTGGRYYVLQMLDMWTDVFAAPGSRTSGTKAGDFAIVGPRWNGKLPDGVERLRCPTNIGWIIGRTQTNGKADYENVHRIQDGFKLTPLSQRGKSYTPLAESPEDHTVDMKTPPPIQLAKMSAQTYFEMFADLMKNNPPHELDWPMVVQLRQIGIVPGKDFVFSKLDPQTQKALERAVGEARKMIEDRAERSGEFVNGWLIAREGMGNYGTSYLQRANVALIGLGANVPDDAVYPMSFVDSERKPYNGSNRYVLHLDNGQLPVNAFWSLTMYDEDAYFADNSIRRYAIGDRDKLKFNNDGSLDIYIQHESPGKDKESNWLPAPKDTFNLVIRLYWPKTEILTGAWNPPAVERIR
jgi:hypothetical protein